MGINTKAGVSLTIVNPTTALDAIYARLPKIECKKLCHASCGSICMTEVEYERIRRVAGRDVRWTGADCPLLKDNLCSVYKVRPYICRVWGLVPKMACPFGCVPERWLTPEEEKEFFHEIEKVGGGYHGVNDMMEALGREMFSLRVTLDGKPVDEKTMTSFLGE